MKNLRISFAVLMLVAACSCKKETTASKQPVAMESLESTAKLAGEAKWQGGFISYNGLPASQAVSNKIFIRNGYARIYSDAIHIDSGNYYSTRFKLIIPTSVKIKGDSINFEIGVKNPANASFYAPFYGRDVRLYIKGETNSATVTNVVTNDINPNAGKRALMKLGNTVIKNIPQLQYNFEDWGTFIVQTFNRGMVAYRNNEFVKGLPYGNEPLIGRLKEIGIDFKGSGYIDYIKLYNSVNNKLIMSEDFNVDGQSTIIWY